jgi:PAS domain S-box-containing protein
MPQSDSQHLPDIECIEFDFERFFNLSPDLLCIAGFDGYFKKVNPAVSNLLEYSADELYSRPINDFVHPYDKDATTRARENLAKSKPLHYFENRYITKSGKVIWLSWTSQPVESDSLVFAVAKDITHKKKLETERLALLENLTAVNKELKQYNLTTSHDLRSPLTNLMTVFDLLDISKISDPETRQLISLFKLTGDQLKNTLNSYVNVLSENHKGPVQVEETDLEATLTEVIESVKSLIRTSNASIRTDFSKIRSVRFNKAYLESVYLNLITNSLKYSRPDVSPEITIHSETGNGEPRLIFSDNGLGFDMDKVKNRIFGLNQTFHDHHDSKGVGLYLVYSHISEMGGTIEVDSVVNKGTRFVITFPSPD